MSLRIYSLIKAIALCAEMVIHPVIFAFLAAAMLAQKAGAYAALQFSMDIGVMLAILVLMLFKHKYKDREPSRVPNVTCFSVIFSLSLMGAAGLTIRATSGGGFCGEFVSAHPEKCREAGFVIAMSWTSVIIAIVGILVSWLDKYPGAVEVSKLYTPQRSVREIELLRQRSPSEPMNISPRIHIPRPPPASYTAARLRDPHHTQGSTQSVPTFQRHSQKFSSSRVPSSLPSPLPGRENKPASLMLNRKMHGPVGQTPRDQSILTRTYDLQALPYNVNPVKRNTRKANEGDMWKQKYLV